MTGDAGLLAATLADPGTSTGFDPARWSLLVKQARVAELLGQLRARLDEGGVLEGVPGPVRRHLDIAWSLSLRHRTAVQWEVMHVRDALSGLGIRVVLLKGAAYCIAGSSAAMGRVFNDVDILVPRARLAEAEHCLIRAGWLPARVDAYDQRYYRRWMHELPPMEHKSRGTVLDVHHTIVPPTSGILPDPAVLIAASLPLTDPELRMFSVLAPEDMVIHSACHLFLGEFHKGLRDLYDLYRLFGDFSRCEGFWERLTARAVETGLSRPLLDALQQVERVFGLKAPASARAELIERDGRALAAPLHAWMFEHVLRPDHPSCDCRASAAARWLAYARAHWLRMPLPLLAYHLAHKALLGQRH